MNVLGKPVLEDLKKNHADVRTQANAWLQEAEAADWKSPSDIKARYPAASILPNNNVVFNLKGNRYRLHVKIHYDLKIVLICRAGTHDDYSTWNF